jgi:hypothetical protein
MGLKNYQAPILTLAARYLATINPYQQTHRKWLFSAGGRALTRIIQYATLGRRFRESREGGFAGKKFIGGLTWRGYWFGLRLDRIILLEFF